MNSKLWITGEFTMIDGKVETFKEIANTVIATVQSNEPDTLMYELHFSDDQTKCLALKQYRNSQAVLTHLENFVPMLPKIFETAQLTRTEIYGNASDELKQALASLGAKFFKHWSGFVR